MIDLDLDLGAVLVWDHVWHKGGRVIVENSPIEMSIEMFIKIFVNMPIPDTCYRSTFSFIRRLYAGISDPLLDKNEIQYGILLWQ